MKPICLLTLLCLCLVAGSLSAAADETRSPALTFLEPEDPSVVSTDGTLSLRWTGGGKGATYRLERSREAGFADALTVYEGGDQGTFASGLTSGIWNYRLLAVDAESGQALSDPAPATLEVQVEFVSAGRVWWLMSAGAITLVCIVGSVLTGYRRNRGWTLNQEGA